MYKIIQDGVTIAMTDAPIFIKMQDNGCYALCTQKDATGIVSGGVVYQLLGNILDGAAETVMLEEMDAGAELNKTAATTADIDAIVVDQEYRLTILELGLTE